MSLDLQKVEDLALAARNARAAAAKCYSAKLRSLGGDSAAVAWEKTDEGKRYRQATTRLFRITKIIEAKLNAYRDSGALSRWWFDAENRAWANRYARELADATRQIEASTQCTVKVATTRFGDVKLADWLTGGMSTQLLIAGAVVVGLLVWSKT